MESTDDYHHSRLLTFFFIADELNRRTEFYEKTEKAKNDDNTGEVSLLS